MKEELQLLDKLQLNFNSEGLFALNLVLAFIMFGIALEIKPKHFKEVFTNPKSAIIGILSQFFVLPLVTFIFAILISNYITIGVALGMIMVASCPGGNISNFISHLARGNTALSVSLTGFSSLGAIILTPANFAFYGTQFINYTERTSELVRPLSINPVQMFTTVFIILGIPLIIGLQFSRFFPTITEKIIKPIKLVSIIGFVGFIVIAFSNNFEHFISHIEWVTLIVFFHNLLAILTGLTVAALFKLPPINRKTIAIETGIQNSGLALVLIFNPKIFPPDLEVGAMAYIAAWWGIWHIIAGLAIAFLWKNRYTSTIRI
ncbi:MAG: bile acid:sodium symporter family protein [Salinivirgaceae bacterium]|jgi:BASS family bile acid:Na+ symporter|nr:bile acid:sodium symporter family protein [Salinivirgaceae bacterium]